MLDPASFPIREQGEVVPERAEHLLPLRMDDTNNLPVFAMSYNVLRVMSGIPGSAVVVPLTIDSKGRIVAASNLHL